MLKLSYDKLHPNRLKLCFLYCSLFPKGLSLKNHRFICLCLALGYMEAPRHENKNLLDVAEDYLTCVKNLSFIDYFGYEGDSRISMYDTIHDLAISPAKSKYNILTWRMTEDKNLTKELGMCPSANSHS